LTCLQHLLPFKDSSAIPQRAFGSVDFEALNVLWKLSAHRAAKLTSQLRVSGVVVNFRSFLLFAVQPRLN
jgi:hypothetical protein